MTFDSNSGVKTSILLLGVSFILEILIHHNIHNFNFISFDISGK